MLWHLEAQEGRLLGPVPPAVPHRDLPLTCCVPQWRLWAVPWCPMYRCRRAYLKKRDTRVAVRGVSTGLGTDRKTDVCMCASVSAYSDRTSSSKPALMTTLL